MSTRSTGIPGSTANLGSSSTGKKSQTLKTVLSFDQLNGIMVQTLYHEGLLPLPSLVENEKLNHIQMAICLECSVCTAEETGAKGMSPPPEHAYALDVPVDIDNGNGEPSHLVKYYLVRRQDGTFWKYMHSTEDAKDCVKAEAGKFARHMNNNLAMQKNLPKTSTDHIKAEFVAKFGSMFATTNGQVVRTLEHCMSNDDLEELFKPLVDSYDVEFAHRESVFTKLGESGLGCIRRREFLGNAVEQLTSANETIDRAFDYVDMVYPPMIRLDKKDCEKSRAVPRDECARYTKAKAAILRDECARYTDVKAEWDSEIANLKLMFELEMAKEKNKTMAEIFKQEAKEEASKAREKELQLKSTIASQGELIKQLQEKLRMVGNSASN